eukprot:6200459-Pleurochrysis_carterae.AAC.5
MALVGMARPELPLERRSAMPHRRRPLRAGSRLVATTGSAPAALRAPCASGQHRSRWGPTLHEAARGGRERAL